MALFSGFSGYMVSGVHHGRNGEGQRHLPGHRPYPSQLVLPAGLSLTPFISILKPLGQRHSSAETSDKNLLNYFLLGFICLTRTALLINNSLDS